jgi:hypothetical protein
MADAIGAMRTELATLSTEVRLMIQRVDPMLLDHEQRLRVVEQRPQVADLPDRVREVEKWQWKRDTALALGSSGVGGAIVAVVTAITGG